MYPVINPLIYTDQTDKQIFTNTYHKTTQFIGPSDTTGIFFDMNNIIIAAGDTSISIGHGEIYINGKLQQRDLVENTTRGFITNPLGMLPGTVIPMTIPAAFNKFPDPLIITPFISIGTMLVDLTTLFLT